jgi:hypothetical protein
VNRHERRAAGQQRHILPGSGLVDGMVPIVLDHIWAGSLDKLEQNLAPQRRARVSAAVMLGEIKSGGVTCSACEAALSRLEEVGVCTVAHFGAGSPLGEAAVGIPFCRRCATSEAEVSAKTRTALTRLFGGRVISKQ